MPRDRLSAQQIIPITGGGQKQRTIVPGVKIFGNDYISDWIDSNLAPNDINLSLLRDKHAKWLKFFNNSSNLKDIRLSSGSSHKLNTINNRKKEWDYKREHLEDIIKLSKNKPSGYDELKNRHFVYSELNECDTLTTKTRLLVGLSGGSVFENSLTLHRLYGFPIIPGSALKGIAHHFCDEYLDSSEISDDDKKAIFGAKAIGSDDGGLEGQVVFMDAWPDAWPDGGFFELDVINPHYPDYYRETSDSYPKDNQNPIPNLFLAVRTGVTFKFCVMPSSKCKNYVYVKRAMGILKEALTTIGVGAKTGSSYGYFI